MGTAMARRFSAAGHDLTLWNRSEAVARDLAEELGARHATTAAEAAGAAEVVVSSLADDEAVRSVYLGSDGIVAGLGPDTVAADTSTIAPATVAEVGAAVDATGAGFVDSPVSGSVSTVAAGELVVMAGGDAEHIAVVEPIMDAIARRVVHVGERGAGAACKLAVNALVHGINTALSEALVIAERAGVDRAVAYDIFASGAGGAPFVQYKREAFEHPDTAPVAFSLELVAKDMELITGLAERVGVRADQAAVTRRLVSEALEAGLGSRDMSALAVFLRGGGS